MEATWVDSNRFRSTGYIVTVFLQFESDKIAFKKIPGLAEPYREVAVRDEAGGGLPSGYIRAKYPLDRRSVNRLVIAKHAKAFDGVSEFPDIACPSSFGKGRYGGFGQGPSLT
jgi:hypothetical protein